MVFQVVVGESLLLLCDSARCDENTLGGQTRSKKNVFTDAVDNSQLFARPAYIKLCSTWTNVVTRDVILQLGDSTGVTQLHSSSVDANQSSVQQDANGHCATLF
jgi:hypothetical protein